MSGAHAPLPKGPKTITFACANLRSVTHLMPLTSSILRPIGADVVALSEVKLWDGETVSVPDFDYFGFHEEFTPEEDFDKNRRAGCGLLVRTTLRDRVIALPQYSCPNIGWIRIRATTKDEPDRFVCTFYGTCRSVDNQKTDALFDRLHATVAMLKPKGQVVLMGDFNAHTDSRLGPNHLPCDVDVSGERLCQLAGDMELTALNAQSFCDGTLTRIQGRERSVIDYILTDTEAMRAQTHPRPNCVVLEESFYGSDHRVIYTRLPDRSARSRPRRPQYLDWEFRRRGNDVDWSLFAPVLRSELDQWSRWLDSTPDLDPSAPLPQRRELVNRAAAAFTSSVLLASERHFDRAKVGGKCKPWWTPALESLFLTKSAAYSLHRAAVEEPRPPAEIAAAAKALRLASRRFSHAVVRAKQKQRDVHAQRAEELFSTPMEYACHPNHKFYWRHIKKARGTRTQMPTSLLSADGTRTVTEPADLKERWFEYYQEMACPPSPEVGGHVEEVEACSSRTRRKSYTQ